MNEPDTSELEKTFDEWLKVPWPSPNVSPRQQFWLAFKAGAEWALRRVREEAGVPQAADDDFGKR